MWDVRVLVLCTRLSGQTEMRTRQDSTVGLPLHHSMHIMRAPRQLVAPTPPNWNWNPLALRYSFPHQWW